MKGKKVHDILNRLHLSMPTKRDEKVPTFVLVKAYGLNTISDLLDTSKAVDIECTLVY